MSIKNLAWGRPQPILPAAPRRRARPAPSQDSYFILSDHRRGRNLWGWKTVRPGFGNKAASYTDLPIAAAGLTGGATMQDGTTKVAIGVCVIDVANSRCYTPAQAATGDTILIEGSYEV